MSVSQSRLTSERRAQLAEMFANATPVALTLIMQTLRCTQCKRHYLAPSAQPMVTLKAIRGSAVRHVKLKDYPYALAINLPRRVVHIDGPVEYCEHCFNAGDNRQLELFPAPLRPELPLPFNGSKPWEDKPKPAKPEKVAKPIITLDYF